MDFGRLYRFTRLLRRRVFLVIIFATLALRLLWLDVPGSVVFDEWYYVNSAHVILDLPQTLNDKNQIAFPDSPAGKDPNDEHPPLGKLLISVGIALLGDNAAAWRIVSVILSSIGVVGLYFLVKRLESERIALIAAVIYSFENLSFIHGRIAMLDTFMVSFTILGFLAIQRSLGISAIFFALAALSKLPGIFPFLGALIYLVVRDRMKNIGIRDSFYRVAFFAAVTTLSFLAILWVLDIFWARFTDPISHLLKMQGESLSLTTERPEGIASLPWQWLVNEVKIPYFRVDITVKEGERVVSSFIKIFFSGEFNWMLLFALIPSIGYAAYTAKRGRNELSIMALIWFAAAYLPYYPLHFLAHRIMYLFYLLPAVPPLALAISRLIGREELPDIIPVTFTAAYLIIFALQFPFRVIP